MFTFHSSVGASGTRQPSEQGLGLLVVLLLRPELMPCTVMRYGKSGSGRAAPSSPFVRRPLPVPLCTLTIKFSHEQSPRIIVAPLKLLATLNKQILVGDFKNVGRGHVTKSG